MDSDIDRAKKDTDAEIIVGGNYDKSVGYFIEPTIIVTTNPHYSTMETELFGPVMTIYVYEDAKWEETLKLVDSTSEYALTEQFSVKTDMPSSKQQLLYKMQQETSTSTTNQPEPLWECSLLAEQELPEPMTKRVPH